MDSKKTHSWDDINWSEDDTARGRSYDKSRIAFREDEITDDKHYKVSKDEVEYFISEDEIKHHDYEMEYGLKDLMEEMNKARDEGKKLDDDKFHAKYDKIMRERERNVPKEETINDINVRLNKNKKILENLEDRKKSAIFKMLAFGKRMKSSTNIDINELEKEIARDEHKLSKMIKQRKKENEKKFKKK
jgi:hypothetical protein